ncbi:MAG: gamma-glutamylcyclotransferase [Methanosarcinaceae archaeon]|nr:gamma-glutamylcyclotransferase [Methanosarcinaceae archaeon]
MYVFVYGTLKIDCSDHGLLDKSKFICASRTEKKYTMLDLGMFPGVTREGEISSIYGEVYEVDRETLKCLDNFEGKWFSRELVSLDCGFSAWMYFLEEIPVALEEKAYPIKNGIWTN